MSMRVLLRLIASTADADPEAHAWLAQGLQRWRDGEDLQHALDLVGPGANQAAEAALFRAALLLDPQRTKPAHPVAVQLAAALERFERRTWPRISVTEDPGSLGTLDRALWEALVCSAQIPRSPRRLFDLLTRKGWQRQREAYDDDNVQHVELRNA